MNAIEKIKGIKILYLVKKRGAALIITLSVLTLLIIMALGVATNMMYEEKGSVTFHHGMLAGYAAEAGISRAVIELRNDAFTNYMDTTAESWYHTRDTIPSFDTLWGDPANNSISFEIKGDNYISQTTLRVIDCASMIYINDKASFTSTLTGAARRRIFNNLFNLLGIVTESGDDVYNEMENNGPYSDWSDLIARTTLVEDDKGDYWNGTVGDPIELIDCITFHSYRDPDVIDGNDLTGTAYQKDPRAPININTANIVVLEAVCRGLRADNCCPNCGGDGKISYQFWPNIRHDVCNACSATGDLVISNSEAGWLAEWIEEKRPFNSYTDFYKRLKTDSNFGSPNGTNKNRPVGQCDADLILANFNSNPGFSPGSRDRAWGKVAGYVSKCRDIRPGTLGTFTTGDQTTPGLSRSTTEFCFNSGGYYLIESTGEVFNQQGLSLAKKRLETYVKIFEKKTHTTQKQFHDPNPIDAGVRSGVFTSTLDYPEPTRTTVTGFTTGFANVFPGTYDGYIMRDFVRNFLPNTGDHFLMQFDHDNLVPNSCGNSHIFPIKAENITEGPLANPANPGDVLREGILITKREKQLLAYRARENLNHKEATIEMWYKNLFNRQDNHNYGWHNTSTNRNTAVVEKTLLWVTEQFDAQRYLPLFGTNGDWASDGSDVYWYWCDKALGRPDDPPIINPWNSTLWKTGRNMYHVWNYNISNSQVLGINTMGCGTQGGGTGGLWEWMRLTSNGFSHNQNSAGMRYRGEWTHVATAYEDLGWNFTQYPLSDPDGDGMGNPDEAVARTDWVHTGPSPEAAINGHNIPSFNGDSHPAQANWEKNIYIDGVERTTCNWGFVGRGIMQFAEFTENTPAQNSDPHLVFGAQFETYPYGHPTAVRRKAYAEGVISGIRIWDSKRSAAQIDADAKQGRYSSSMGISFSSPLFVRKNANDQWGCVFWTQYIPDFVAAPAIKLSSDRVAWAGVLVNNNGEAISGLGLGNDLFYRVVFPNRGAPLVDTIVFDDIRVTYLIRPSFRNYKEITD